MVKERLEKQTVLLRNCESRNGNNETNNSITKREKDRERERWGKKDMKAIKNYRKIETGTEQETERILNDSRKRVKQR